MSAKYKSPSFLLPNELNTSANPANDTGINSLYSMDFDGSSQYVNTPQIDLGSTNSISFWINNTASNSGTLFGDPNAYNTTYALSWSTTANILSFRLGNGDNGYWQLTVSSGLLRDGNWHHHCLTRDGVTINYYIDGVLQTNVTNNTLNASAGTNTTIKNIMARSNGTSFASGKLDEVAIFNRALNTTEIAALYGGTSPNIYPSNLMATDLGPVAYYPLGEQAQNSGYLSATGNEWQFPNGVLQDYVMDFDSTSPGDYISAPMTMLNSATQCTISFWGKKDASNKELVVGGRISISEGIWIQWYSDGNVYFSPRGTGATGFSVSYAQLYDNNWHHYIGVYDGSSAANCKLYLDGDLVATGSGTAPSSLPATTGDNFQIGALSTSHYTDGQISNVAVWNTAITDSAQIANIYNNGSPQTTYTVTPQNWWKLNTDSVYTPSAPNYTTALDFDGSSDYIDLNFQSQTTPATISMWVNTDVNDSQQRYAIINGRADQQPTVYLRMQNDNTYQVFISNTNGSDTLQGSSATINTWFHFAIVCENSQTLLYENGVLKDSSTIGWNGIDIDQSNNWQLGRDSRGQRYWKGKISNASICNTALTSTQISTLFNFGTPETNISFNPTHWWKLDDQTAITNYGSGGINGTNNGATDATTSVAVVPSWKIPDASGTSNGVSTTLPSTALQQSDLQFDSPYSNYSLSFDGTGDYIDLGNADSLKLRSGDFTFSAWINPDSWGSGYEGIYVNAASNGVWIGNGGNGNFVLRIYGVSNIIAYSTLPTINTWTHICITRNSGLCSLFYNGSSVATATSTHDFNGSANVFIGSDTGGADFNGKIDETSIFNYGLSDAQILEIYNNGRPNDLSTFSGTAPISWWRLGENAYFDNNSFVVPNSITGAPNGTGSGSITTMISADAPGTYANGIGTNLDILDRVGDAPLSTSNSQSYNMIPSDISPYVPGYVGLQTDNIYSMNFDSASADYISIGSLINLGTSSTISFWYKTSSNNQGLVPFGGASAPYYYVVQWGSSVNKVYFRVGTTVHEFTGVTEIEDGSWHHYCIVRTGADAELFVDGNSRDTLTGLPSATDTLIDTIGATSNGTSNLNNSYLDEVGFWNTALNADQVNFDLYQPSLPAGSNKTADIANNPNLPTPVAWYRMGD